MDFILISICSFFLVLFIIYDSKKSLDEMRKKDKEDDLKDTDYGC